MRMIEKKGYWSIICIEEKIGSIGLVGNVFLMAWEMEFNPRLSLTKNSKNGT